MNNNNDRLRDNLAERLAAIERLNELTNPSSSGKKETDAEKEARFARYRAARVKRLKDAGKWNGKTCYPEITLEELEYNMKTQLRETPEERYRARKEHWYFHPSSYWARGLEAYDGKGCDWTTGCVPECPFYLDTGRIEDEEVIDRFEKAIEKHRREGTLIEIPDYDNNNNL